MFRMLSARKKSSKRKLRGVGMLHEVLNLFADKLKCDIRNRRSYHKLMHSEPDGILCILESVIKLNEGRERFISSLESLLRECNAPLNKGGAI